MSEQQYDIFFRGEALDGADLNTVKAHFGKLFKADDAKIAQLFSGKVIPLKKNLAKADAAKFQQLFKNAGAKIYIKAAQTPTSKAAPIPTPAAQAPKAAAPIPSPNIINEAPSAAQAEPPIKAEPPVKAASPIPSPSILDAKPIEEPTAAAPIPIPQVAEEPSTNNSPASAALNDLSIAPPGTDVLAEDERPHIEAVAVDTSSIHLASAFDIPEEEPDNTPPAPDVSHISAADVGADLVDHSDDLPPPPAPDVSHISTADLGVDMQDSYDETPELEIDLSSIDLAPPGPLENLAKEPDPEAPDTSHLQLS